MPQIRMFRRRWRVSTDSLPVLAFILFLVHLGCFVAVVIMGAMIGTCHDSYVPSVSKRPLGACIAHVLTLLAVLLAACAAGSEYQCNQKDQIAACLYGLLTIVCLLMIDDAIVFFGGLVGGPFEDKRRRPVVIGMYAQFALLVLLTLFAIYGTVFASSNLADRECWSKNPCKAIESVVPQACLGTDSLAVWARESQRVTDLTPACQALNTVYERGVVNRCLINYLDLAGEYGVAVYNESAQSDVDGVRTGPFNQGVIESAVTCKLRGDLSTELSQEEASANFAAGIPNTTELLDQAAKNGTLGLGVFNVFWDTFRAAVDQSEKEGFNPNTIAFQTAQQAARYFPNLLANIGVIILGRAFGMIDTTTPFIIGPVPLPENYTGLLEQAPWYQQCADTTLKGCDLVFGSTCNQWDVLTAIDDSSDEKGLFYAAIGVAWGSILFSTIFYYLSFNSFVDYSSDEAWIALVNKVGGFLGWTSVLKNSVTEAGFTASEELGLLLKKIFGGIDMDLTDRLLGAYLAGERRDWRRLRTIVSKLEIHGYTMKKQTGCMWGFCEGGGIDGYGLTELKSKVESTLGMQSGSTVMHTSSKGQESGESVDIDERRGRDHSGVLVSNMETIVLPQNVLPMTPFDATSNGRAAQATNLQDTNTRASGNSDENRGDSGTLNGHPNLFDRASTTTANLDSTPGDRSIEVSYSFVRLDSSLHSSIGMSPRKWKTSRRSQNDLESLPSVGIKDDTKAIKVMVPVNLSRIEFEPPINSRDAASIYLDDNLGVVPVDVLQDALRYCAFSRAAYGLQTKLWRGGRDLSGDHSAVKCMDGILSSRFFPRILKSTIDVEGRFKKRNFDAILQLTGIPAEDFLYVSYSNTTFGKLPFLVMLDRANKKIILSIRGTAGLEDLITDLLSKPVDMNALLPQSVLDALPPKTTVYGHAGIMSSAKAIIATLNEEGILQTIDTHVGSPDTRPANPRWPQTNHTSTSGQSFKDQSRMFLKHVSSLKADMEVEFSLERAQTAVFDALFMQDYDVVVTGHSLGAAVASIVSVVLKQKYPSLKCYAFNPPGGVVSPVLSELAAPYITSIVVGYDAISRLGLTQVKDLVDDMVFSLCRCKRPKLKIATDVLLSKRKDPLTAPRTYCSFEDVDDAVKDIIVEYMAASLVHEEDIDSQELVPVGSVVFLRPYVQKDGVEEWDAVYASATDIINEGILVSKYALAHHRFASTISALEFCIQERESAPSAP